MPNTIPNRETLSLQVDSSRRRLDEALDVIRGMMVGTARPARNEPPLQDALTALCSDLEGLKRDIDVIQTHLDYGTVPRIFDFHVPFDPAHAGEKRETPFTD